MFFSRNIACFCTFYVCYIIVKKTSRRSKFHCKCFVGGYNNNSINYTECVDYKWVCITCMATCNQIRNGNIKSNEIKLCYAIMQKFIEGSTLKVIYCELRTESKVYCFMLLFFGVF